MAIGLQKINVAAAVKFPPVAASIRCKTRQIVIFEYTTMLPKLFLILLSAILPAIVQSQNCTARGQNPSTAFPVCGLDTFRQVNVPICGVRPIPTPCTDNISYTDKNPFWYKFTCYTTGTLGFVITPFNLNDDYDWQIFDVTGRNPDDVYTDRTLFVSCNWSSRPGATGTGGSGTVNVNCAGPSYPNFNVMPVLIQDHDYIILISHFTDSQEGYFLSFGGGTAGSANITDPKLPLLSSARPNCDGSSITVKLNKKMKCNSLSVNGSDFVLSPPVAAVTGATGVGCSNGFDTDSLILSLASPIPAGSYFLTAQNGADGNTMLDNCDRLIPVGDRVTFNYIVPVPIRADSIGRIGCAPDKIRVFFPQKINCSSITPSGSDFSLTGSSPITITGATGDSCQNGSSSVIILQLSSPIYTQGTYTLGIIPGLDGSPVFDVCGQPILPQTFSFTARDTVSANFTASVMLGCKIDTIQYSHDGRNGVNSWRWTFDSLQTSTQQNPQLIYSVFGTKTARLIVSNGVCSSTAWSEILLDNEIKAAFISTDVICPNDTTVFRDTSIGRITRWQWSFGNGNTSIFQNPPAQVYPLIDVLRKYPVQLIVEDAVGCKDTLTKNITAVANCYIAVPTGFTPNGDGVNDYLYPLNAYKADNLEFKVYNRLGQLIWQTKDWTRKWDGRMNGQLLTTQAFVWTLNYTNRDTGLPFRLKGTTVLIR
ncbi:MAG: gliding motility-associated C-terminal domain-containing protein [Bacteroidota bacterium]